MGENKDVKTIEPAEARELVVKISKAVRAFLISETQHVDGRNRWLVIGRVVSNLFSWHFKTAIRAAVDANPDLIEADEFPALSKVLKQDRYELP